MKTEVILQREILTGVVKQKSKSGMFSASDLVRVANIRRRELNRSPFNLSSFLKQKGTSEFIEELQNAYPGERIIIIGRGRSSNTWVHPLLFIDIALALDSKLKLEVYNWLYDELLKYRNDSGKSYKKMTGAVFERYENKNQFYKYIPKVANYIKESCKVADWNKATEQQLKLRDKMHENIYLLCSVLRDTDFAVRAGVEQALKELKDE